MSLPVVFRGLADREVHEIQTWYEARQAGLGGRFRASLELVVQLISQHPLACPLAHRDARRALVPGFPYALFVSRWRSFLLAAELPIVMRLH